MYKGKNLLAVPASQDNKYCTAIMKILFTHEELAKGYVIEGPSTSKRIPLDRERIEILKSKKFFISF